MVFRRATSTWSRTKRPSRIAPSASFIASGLMSAKNPKRPRLIPTSGIPAAATSVATITSLTLTITVVTLQLASSQYSPRLIEHYLNDRGIRAHEEEVVPLRILVHPPQQRGAVRIGNEVQIEIAQQSQLTAVAHTESLTAGEASPEEHGTEGIPQFLPCEFDEVVQARCDPSVEIRIGGERRLQEHRVLAQIRVGGRRLPGSSG